MDEEKERQNEVKEKLEDAGLDPDEFDEDPPPHEATDGHSEQPACVAGATSARRRPACADLRFAGGFGKARASAGREELADLI